MIKKGFQLLRREGLKGFWRKAVFLSKLSHRDRYPYWLEQNRLTEVDRLAAIRRLAEFPYRPLISVLVPVYNVEEKWLRSCIDSVMQQLYPYWELCIADDASTAPHVRRVLEEYGSLDRRIKVVYRETNGHISAASNSALELAAGEFVALLDHDDRLTPDALYENVRLLNEHPDADMIYSDEDKISETGRRHSPLFKPDWSPDTFLAQMYTCHLGVYRTALVREAGGFREGFEGSQDYDLVLRLSEKTDCIFHIPKVLYSWRETASSTAGSAAAKPYAHESGLRALNEHLSRKYENREARCESTRWTFVYDVRYELPAGTKISVIIPIRDRVGLLKKCLESIVQKTGYDRYEIIVMDNGSSVKETLQYFEKIKSEKIKIVDAAYPFNWARINNHGMDVSGGDVFIFLNNDTVVISEDWLQRLAEKALREDIGTVGALLLYEDGTIQHAGVVVGMGGWADHVFKGLMPEHYGSPFISPVITRNVLASTGACLAVSRKTVERIGRFNEDFIICGSDVEFSIRAHKKGLRNLYDPGARLYHLESKSRKNIRIPESDFQQSARFYKEFLESGDPYYNRNLDLHSLIPAVIPERR
ncbi:MAG: glycosyltransferase family 2 protein [Bacillota bacterium]